MARKEKGEFFSARRQTKQHKTTAIPLSELDNGIDPIYAATFAHHIIDKLISSGRGHEYKSTSGKITETFHNKFYRCQLYRYREGNTLISIDDFFNVVCADPTNPVDTSPHRVGPNLISVLIGRIGIGKSTFLSHLLILYRRGLRVKNFIPIIMDVERFAGPTASKNEFFRHLFVRIHDAIIEDEILTREDAEKLFQRCQPTPVEDELIKGKLYALAIKQYLVEIFWETGRHIFLCLDNIDKYYYLFDRGGFSDIGDQLRQVGMQKLADIISEFESPSGTLDGAGINVLVCMRRHTLEYLLASGSVFPSRRLNPIEDGSHVFRLATPTPESVISSRIDLLKSVLETTPVIPRGAASRSISSLNAVWQNLHQMQARQSTQQSVNMLQDLSNLGNHGHRSLIDFFFGNRWMLDNSSMVARFYKTYSPTILLFMLRNNLRYSQLECKFPNLFLVRGDLETAADSLVPRELIVPHRQTYWLKYLIANYIYSRKLEDKSVTTRELLEIFSPNENGDRCFERPVTELCMGSLAQVDISGVLEPEFGTSLDGQRLAIRDIKLTNRGMLLLERFAFDFTYLQLIVEDYMLEFPDLVFSEFKYFDEINYQYLLQQYDDYQHRATEMIIIKCRQVFYFLLILEVTYKYEKIRRNVTFEKLFARGIKPVNFDAIRSKLLEGILNIGRALNTDKIEGAARGAMESALMLKPKLDQFIRHAYLDYDV